MFEIFSNALAFIIQICGGMSLAVGSPALSLSLAI
jgi:hypothetical protein